MAGVDYYKTLEVDPSASQAQIKDAYKKAALKHHPDRVPASSPERPSRTKKFQQINDAYYTLSDPGRRRDYDATRMFSSSSSTADDTSTDETQVPPGGFPWSSFFFRRQNQQSEDDFASSQFGDVFEEMMRDEGLAEEDTSSTSETQAVPTKRFWSLIGGVSGAAMGFIVANAPGAVAGAVAGNRLGNIRDKKGKSVYAVFLDLDQGQRMRLLGELATRVLGQAMSG